MRLVFSILFALTLACRAASPVFMFNSTNELIAAPIPRVNTNLFGVLSGHTNKNDGWGGLVEFVTNNAATIDWTNVFPASVANSRWRRVVQPVGTNAPARLTVEDRFHSKAFSSFGEDNPGSQARIKTSGTILASAGMGQEFSFEGGLQATADNDTLSIIRLASSFSDGGFSGVTRWAFNNQSGEGMYLGTGLINLPGLTASRILSINGSQDIAVVGAPAADGYILSSTIAGAFSWVPNAAGSSGGNPTASVGLTAVNGSATSFLRSDGAPALDTNIAPAWAGMHVWTGGTRFSSTTAYSGPPTTELAGYLITEAGGARTTVAQIQFGKENATDANTAGYISLATRPNGGSVTTRMMIDSAGFVYIYSGVLVMSNTISSYRDVTNGYVLDSYYTTSSNVTEKFRLETDGTMRWGATGITTDSPNLKLFPADTLTLTGSFLVASNVTINSLTASQFVKTDSNKKLVSATISNSDLPSPVVVPTASPYAITRKTDNYTATTNDVTMIFNGATGNPITNTLPVTSAFDGHMFIIMRNGGDSLVIEQSGSGTMETLTAGWAVRAYMWLHTESRYQLLWSQPGT